MIKSFTLEFVVDFWDLQFQHKIIYKIRSLILRKDEEDTNDVKEPKDVTQTSVCKWIG